MREERTTALASLTVFAMGALWGFYWLPVRALDQTGLTGAWGTLAITIAAILMLLPFVLSRRRDVLRVSPVALVSVALGGAAFALYSIGFVYGRVAIIILLYFLTPVWSTLIARFVMSWETPPMRLVAIAVGLAGLGLMLGAEGGPPLPRGVGEWMALIAGVLWSVATTGIRATSTLEPVEAALVFCVGAALTSLALAPALEPLPGGLSGSDVARGAGLAFVAGGFWWVLSMLALMWATVRLDPARVGILLMAEVLVGAVSAAIWAGELLTAVEIVGGAMVLSAGLLEVWPGPKGYERS